MSKQFIQIKKSNVPPEFFTTLNFKTDNNIPLYLGVYGVFDRKSLTEPCIVTKVSLENQKVDKKIVAEFDRYVKNNVKSLSGAALIDLFGFVKNINYIKNVPAH